jgi:predicted dehydrogenase
MLQALFGYDATVLDASVIARAGVDETIRATLAMPGIPVAEIRASMWSRSLLSSRLEIVGSDGSLAVRWPFQPQVGVRIRVRTAEGTIVHRVDRKSTYRWQLEAFRDSVLHGSPVESPVADSVAMMTVIDAIYERAGMRPRQPLR